MSEEFLWVEKYRPHTIKDCVLPKHLKDTFQNIVDKGQIPNMILSGTAGLGKTTVARAICDELDADYIVINGSDERNIDVLRGKIKQFASSVSLMGGYKVVILDEGDYLNAQSTQPAMRGFIEDFSSNCRFIFTCNFKNKIIEPLHSRCTPIEFNTNKKDLMALCGQFMVRLQEILTKEEVEYNDKALVDIIQAYAPDWRRVLNECQKLSIGGDLTQTSGVKHGEQYNILFKYLKEKDFKGMRGWVVNNVDIEPASIYRGIYDAMNTKVDSGSIPQLVLILADYQYKNAFVADHELNVVACMTEIMAAIQFK
jgi:DNA polymerase III delta prime subunit